jgi:hypothetical protein
MPDRIDTDAWRLPGRGDCTCAPETYDPATGDPIFTPEIDCPVHGLDLAPVGPIVERILSRARAFDRLMRDIRLTGRADDIAGAVLADSDALAQYLGDYEEPYSPAALIPLAMVRDLVRDAAGAGLLAARDLDEVRLTPAGRAAAQTASDTPVRAGEDYPAWRERRLADRRAAEARREADRP